MVEDQYESTKYDIFYNPAAYILLCDEIVSKIPCMLLLAAVSLITTPIYFHRAYLDY